MAGRRVAVNVTALDEDGRYVTYLAGDEVPAKVAEGIENPKAWAEPEPEAEGADVPAKKAAAKPPVK